VDLRDDRPPQSLPEFHNDLLYEEGVQV
jgi:hypothetical protein